MYNTVAIDHTIKRIVAFTLSVMVSSYMQRPPRLHSISDENGTICLNASTHLNKAII